MQEGQDDARRPRRRRHPPRCDSPLPTSFCRFAAACHGKGRPGQFDLAWHAWPWVMVSAPTCSIRDAAPGGIRPFHGPHGRRAWPASRSGPRQARGGSDRPRQPAGPPAAAVVGQHEDVAQIGEDGVIRHQPRKARHRPLRRDHRHRQRPGQGAFKPVPLCRAFQLSRPAAAPRRRPVPPAGAADRAGAAGLGQLRDRGGAVPRGRHPCDHLRARQHRPRAPRGRVHPGRRA